MDSIYKIHRGWLSEWKVQYYKIKILNSYLKIIQQLPCAMIWFDNLSICNKCTQQFKLVLWVKQKSRIKSGSADIRFYPPLFNLISRCIHVNGVDQLWLIKVTLYLDKWWKSNFSFDCDCNCKFKEVFSKLVDYF